MPSAVLFDKIKNPEGAGFNHEDRQGCADGTRVLLLADLMTWAMHSKGMQTFWLNGMAGTGKTAVTETLCHLLAKEGILGASFFCSRKTANRQMVNLIFPSLAKTLAYNYPEFHQKFVQVLEHDLDFTSMNLKDQFQTLLVEPAKKAFVQYSRPIVLVIDALDECDRPDALEMFLKIILTENSSSALHFFITSRPEIEIRAGFSVGTHASKRLQDIKMHTVKADIRHYLLGALKQIKDSSQAALWPPAELETIVEKSGNLFIYAATGVKYILNGKGFDVNRLRKFALITPPDNAVRAIDEVYSFVLKEAFKGLDDDEKEIVNSCLQTIVCALDPLSVTVYSALLAVDVKFVRAAFASLHSVVQIPEKQKDDHKIILHHASFADYLTSSSRAQSEPWHIDVSSAHNILLNQCLNIMNSKLCFNIADATTSYQSNVQQNLKVHPALEYACGSWPNHLFLSLKQAKIPQEIATNIEQFFVQNSLYWLEVLSVTNKAQYAAAFLSHIYRITESSSLKNMCREFATFISKHLDIIMFSTPHIYLSALPWVAPGSILGQNFLSKCLYLPKIIDSAEPNAWEPLVVQLHGHTDCINSIAYSPYGKHLASGSSDETIRVWDSETGQQTLHIDIERINNTPCHVLSLTYSPNSGYIVCGLSDATIRIWDANTGKPKCKPLFGHDNAVLSIAISPNGKIIASGSADKTVRFWDFHTERQVYKVFSTQAPIQSVAFSSDGEFLVSGGSEHYIRVWKVQTGDMVNEIERTNEESTPIYSLAFTHDSQSVLYASLTNEFKIRHLQSIQEEIIFSGHLASVRSVAFSANSAYIVSGSADNTVKVWNAETRKELIPALSGHSSMIKCVAFAPDGNSVASGSEDKTINIWHISEALQDLEKAVEDSTHTASLSKSFEVVLEGHANGVTSVVFSPDGKLIASGCDDNTVGIWHVDTGMPKFPLLKYHRKSVNIVAWSPDSRLIASGSSDTTIILWNADNGTLHRVLYGHSGYVTSIAFSPNEKHLVSGSYDNTIRIWSLEAGMQAHQVLHGHSDAVKSVAYSANGNLIVSASYDKTVRVWVAKSGAEFTRPLTGHECSVLSAVFTPDGKYIISTDEDGHVYFWDVNAGIKVLRLNDNPITSVAVTPDSKHALFALIHGIVFIWDLEAEKFINFPLVGHNHIIFSIAISSDRKYIATGALDTTIRIWNFSTVTNDPDLSETGFLQYYSPQPFLSGNGKCTYNEDQDLLLWIPPAMMAFLYTPQTHCIIGRRKIKIDLSNYIYGPEWAKCGLKLKSIPHVEGKLYSIHYCQRNQANIIVSEC